MNTLQLKPLGGDQAWHGEQLAKLTDWVHVWSNQSIVELEQAVNTALRGGLRWDEVNRTNFPLKHAAQMLLEVADTLEHGRGLAKLTGLPIDGFTPR